VVSRGNLADLFVTNAFNGTAAGNGKIVRKGTVTRITLQLSADRTPSVLGSIAVASGLAEQASAAAFVLGPTGIAVSPAGTLYVADTATITAIPRAADPSHQRRTRLRRNLRRGAIPAARPGPGPHTVPARLPLWPRDRENNFYQVNSLYLLVL
jgi:hypothetical protein